LSMLTIAVVGLDDDDVAGVVEIGPPPLRQQARTPLLQQAMTKGEEGENDDD
jgi:hypothetical protein